MKTLLDTFFKEMQEAALKGKVMGMPHVFNAKLAFEMIITNLDERLKGVEAESLKGKSLRGEGVSDGN